MGEAIAAANRPFVPCIQIFLYNKAAVIMGCGHAGIVNIMEEAKKYQPHFCIGGFHLFNPLTKKTVLKKLLTSSKVLLLFMY